MEQQIPGSEVETFEKRPLSPNLCVAFIPPRRDSKYLIYSCG